MTPLPSSMDVLVVGAGPGGAAAAYHLARHGVDVTIVDRASFPRDKVCGDGLTPRAVAAMDRMGLALTGESFAPANGLRTYGAGGTVIDLPWPRLRSWPDVGFVARRADFDHLLVRRATDAGARLFEGVEATGPLLDGAWVAGATVRPVDGRDGAGRGGTVEVRARYVIAADGHASRIAGAAGVKRIPTKAMGIAARRYYRSARPFEPILESFLDLRAGGRTMPGYGWIFFLPDGTLNVGAGLLNTFKSFKDVSAKRVFDVFVGGLPPEWGITEENALGPARSGPLPTGFNRAPLAVPGMLLVGDAAGAINPFNGEGISGAMESGEVAAELVVDALARDRPGIAAQYPSVLRARYGKYYSVATVFARMIGNPLFLRTAVTYGVPRKRLMAFLLRLMANLTDGKDGDLDDRVMGLLVSLAPEGS
jgi:geranylgeranyl reductase family protein